MDKTILIEKRSTTLNYIKEAVTNEDGSTRIGRLEGIAADYKNPTRNGRRYPLELWKNVENSDDFKEGMKTHTILGENDHPETRVDTSIKEVSIVLTDFEIRDDGTVWCGFDILPTEEGHKLKALLDYGCQIGVSSRGLGDEIQKDGETIIDPNTYVFYAFDAVIMPAVVTARPSVVESANRQKLSDKFAKDIEKANTVAELESLKKVADVTKLPELGSLVESIDIKLNSLTEGNDISSKLEADLGALAQENESLKLRITELENELSASNTRMIEAKSVISTARDSSSSLTRELSNSNKIIVDLKKESLSLRAKVTELEELDDSNRSKIESLRSTIKDLTSRCKSLATKNESMKSVLKQYEADNKELMSINEDCNRKINKLSSSNKTLNAKIKANDDEIKKLTDVNKLTESKKSNITEKLTESNKELLETRDKYIKTRCSQEGLSYEHVSSRITKNMSLKEIDKLISEMSDQNRRFAKVPILLQPRTAIISESTNVGLTDEDRQTIEFLENFK